MSSKKEDQLLSYWAASSLIRTKGVIEELSEYERRKLSKAIVKMSKTNWTRLGMLAVKLSAYFKELNLRQTYKPNPNSTQVTYHGICHGIEFEVIDGEEGMVLYDITVKEGHWGLVRAFPEDT